MSVHIPAPLPPDEEARLSALQRFKILDTDQEEAFDRITRLVVDITGMPISAVSFVDRTRQWFKASCGLAVRETPRDIAFCAHAILTDNICLVPDALIDPRFSYSPLVTEAPYIRFYAGVPLITHDGFTVGALCVIDTKPHADFSEKDRRILRDLAQIVMDELELRVSYRTRSDFLAMVSHEIRTPMNGVLGMTSFLRETNLDKSQRETLEVISSSAETLLQIINDVLDFSKLDADQLLIEKRPCNIAKIAENTNSLLKNAANANNNVLLIEAAPDLPMLKADPTRLQQLLFNLVGNAIKFTQNGTITVLIKATPKDNDSNAYNWRVEVKDTGIGIAKNDIDKLFKPFSQAETSITRRFGGTGLGLAICKKLMMRVGGDIGVTSNLGEGSTFWFTFAAEKAEHADIIDKTTSVDEPVKASSLHILVGEDDATNQVVIEAMLKKLGHNPVIAKNGKQVLQYLTQEPFDLVFMDIEMPIMNGYEATTEIRKMDEAHRSIPIIALTAHSVIGYQGKYISAGMNDCLSKPLNMQALKEKIEQNRLVLKN